jgi:hypothetical protein
VIERSLDAISASGTGPCDVTLPMKARAFFGTGGDGGDVGAGDGVVGDGGGEGEDGAVGARADEALGFGVAGSRERGSPRAPGRDGARGRPLVVSRVVVASAAGSPRFSTFALVSAPTNVTLDVASFFGASPFEPRFIQSTPASVPATTTIPMIAGIEIGKPRPDERRLTGGDDAAGSDVEGSTVRFGVRRAGSATAVPQ